MLVTLFCGTGCERRIGIMKVTYSWPKPLTKYGLTDDTGAELVPPVFNDLMINKYFIFAKLGKKWGNITDFSSWRDANYDFDDVKVFEYVAWLELHGKWGLVEANGRQVSDYLYNTVEVIENSLIVVASAERDIALFTSTGERLLKDYKIFELPEFDAGYGVATVLEPDSGGKKYFVIRMDGIIMHEFDDKNLCIMYVNELQSY